VVKKLKYFTTFHRNTATPQSTTMTTTIFYNDGGISRMSDNEYDAEYNTGGTPRPGTSSSSSSSSAMMRWSFSQAAKQYAAENKLRLKSKTRTEYRMAANSRINRALQELVTKVQKKAQENPTEAMPESDFQLLKQAIENFQVRIIVHDSTTLDELKEQRTRMTNEMADLASCAAVAEHHADFVQSYKEKESDLKEWHSTLSAEIRRIEPYGFISRMSPTVVPSQHVKIAHTSGNTLRNILSPETIRRRFISLNTLTQTIRRELLEFLTDESRGKDRAEVVQQIKNSCLAAKKQKKC
jgi:hypothetical protein